MFGHAGSVLVPSGVAPKVLRIAFQQTAAFVKRLRAFPADVEVAFLCIAWRCQHAYGKSHGKRGQTFLQVNHDESPSTVFSCRHTAHLDVAGELGCWVLL